MPNEDNKIIKYNQGEKSIKSPFIYLFFYFFYNNMMLQKEKQAKYIQQCPDNNIVY